MFQYEFFSLKDFHRYPKPKSTPPACFAKLSDIRWVRSSYWAEHCLECGEPLCYESCPNFRPRADQRCRLFEYGIYDNPNFPSSPYHAEVHFRKWGKMESIVYPGALSPGKAMEFHDSWKKTCLRKCTLMHLGKLGLKKFPVSERRKFDSQKYQVSTKAGSDNIQDTPSFLLQLYSHEAEPFTLFLDVTDDTDLVFREGITVHPGYNQRCFDMHALFPPKGKLRAKFYPADNAEAAVVFLFCEFVQLKPGVVPASYPEVFSTPADFTAQPANKVKCVAWDLDRTLWNGILIESDPEALRLRPGVLETIQELDRRGIIQIVISKNNEEDVVPVLRRLAVYDYFVAVFSNWSAKSSNLLNAANLLNIGLNTFAHIDDSAFERNEIQYTLPMVRVFPETAVMADSVDFLLKLPEFDVTVTEDTRNRRLMYQDEWKRKQAAAVEKADETQFLRHCCIQCVMKRPETDDELLRCYELLQRTNQLNLSGSKYEKEDFYRHVKEAGQDVYILKCHDRFGSYGQVAYLEVKRDPLKKSLIISEFAMSCRVAGKYIEAALTKALLALYSDDGIGAIELCGTKTSRNSLLIRCFTAVGYEDLSTDRSIRLVFSSASTPEHFDIVSILPEL